MDFKDVLNHDEKFRYQLLSRMKSDCDYYLGNGSRCAKHLWAGDEVKQIAYMKALWNSFGENDKPEWLTHDELMDYEKKIGIKAILVEMDYKANYGRFALTPEEFEKEFPDTYKNFGHFDGVVNTLKGDELSSFEYCDSDTLRPMVHIWFCPTNIGSAVWENFFTDMAWGLPESDIEAGNLAYIDKNQMQSLSKYLEDISVYHCRAVFQHDNCPFAEEEIKLQIMSAAPDADYVIENMKCVEEGPADGAPDFPDDCVFTFEFDIKMPRDSANSINKVLDNVDGGELLGLHYEKSEDEISLEDKIKDAEGRKQPDGPPLPAGAEMVRD